MIKLTLSWEDKHGDTGQTSYEFDSDFDLPKLLRELTRHAGRVWRHSETLVKSRGPRQPDEELPCVL